jgi:isopenicillin N synthase-like dioxygenase
MNSIPVIDISLLVLSSLINEEANLDVSRACDTLGFFQVVGHSVEERLVDSLLMKARRFINQSPEEKQRYVLTKRNSADA